MTMEIDRSNYWQRLPSILQAISEADYLSIDLEMSGIASKKPNNTSSPSLQQLYEDAKEAAQSYNILQVGLTCISWNESSKAYVTKTFNAPLALGIVGGNQHSDQLSTKLERQVGFSSKTIAFLQNNDFKFSHVFEKGIPYLSTMEATQSDMVAFLEDQEDHDHINIRNCPPETGQFYKTMRSNVQAWVNGQAFWEEFMPLLLTSPYNGRFSRFQKQLVRQLIETEFPGYKVQSRDRSLHMEVTKDLGPNPYTKELRRQAVAKQYGFTHVWAAITGQTFASKIDRGLIGTSDREADLDRELSGYEQRIRKNKPIIVGHNMLWDLCFLYQTFVGRLPTTVEDFQRLVRHKMPRIVDTKYLFTRGHHEMMPDQNLEQCFTQAKREKFPMVMPDKFYSCHEASAHQAGYDSYMTAVVFLKKAYQLSRSKQGLEYIPAEDHEQRSFAPTDSIRRSNIRASSRTDSLLDNDDDSSSSANLNVKFKPMVPTSFSAPELAHEKRMEGDHHPAKLPDWMDEEVFWKKYGNKIRCGRTGVVFYTGPNKVVI